MVVSLEHGQGIQTGAIFCNDGSSGVDRVWRDGVLHSSRGSRQNGGGAGRLCTRGKAGEDAPTGTKLPTDADLSMMAQKYFKQQGSGEQQSWDLAFENGYADGFKKTHRPSH